MINEMTNVRNIRSSHDDDDHISFWPFFEQVINEMTNGGADYCFECVGMGTLVQEAYACCRKVFPHSFSIHNHQNKFLRTTLHTYIFCYSSYFGCYIRVGERQLS